MCTFSDLCMNYEMKSCVSHQIKNKKKIKKNLQMRIQRLLVYLLVVYLG